MSFEKFHKVLEFTNGKPSFPERSVFTKVTKLQIGKHSLLGSQVKSPHSAKMHSMSNPWLPVYVDSLACCWCSSAANQAQSFPNVDPSIIRMNDSLACCRSDQVMKTPSKGDVQDLGYTA